MRSRLSHVLLLATGLSGGAIGAMPEPTCLISDAEFIQATQALNDWQKIQAFYRRQYPACPDDGMFAEGYSDVVVRTLAGNWAQLGTLADVAAKDKGFLPFVLRHIDATVDEMELVKIKTFATTQCPPGHRSLCRKIALAAGKAIRELR